MSDRIKVSSCLNVNLFKDLPLSKYNFILELLVATKKPVRVNILYVFKSGSQFHQDEGVSKKLETSTQ